MKDKKTTMSFPYPQERGIKFHFLRAFNFMLNFLITGVAQAGSIIPAFVILYGFLASNHFVATWVASLGLSAGMVTGLYIGTVALLFSVLFVSYGLLYYSEADKALRSFLMDKKWFKIVSEVTDKYNEVLESSPEKPSKSQEQPESKAVLTKRLLEYLNEEIEAQEKSDTIKLLKKLQNKVSKDTDVDKEIIALLKNDPISDRLFYLKHLYKRIQKLQGFNSPSLHKSALERILKERPTNKKTKESNKYKLLQDKLTRGTSVESFFTIAKHGSQTIPTHIKYLDPSIGLPKSINKKEPWYRKLLKNSILLTVGIITTLNAFLVNSFQVAFGALGFLSLTSIPLSFTGAAVLGGIFLIAGTVSSLALTQTALLALVRKMMEPNTKVKSAKTNQHTKKSSSRFSKYLKIAMAFLYASASAGLNFAANLTSGYIILHINQLQNFGAASSFVLSHMATLNPWVIAFGALGGILTFCVSFPFTLDFLFATDQKNRKPSPQWVRSIRYLNVLSISVMLGAFTISSSSIWAVLGATQIMRLLIAAVLIPTVFYLCNKLFAKYTDPSFTALIPDRSLDGIAAENIGKNIPKIIRNYTARKAFKKSAKKIQKIYRGYKAREVLKLSKKYKNEFGDEARTKLDIQDQTSNFENVKAIIKELRRKTPAPNVAFFKKLESTETSQEAKNKMSWETIQAWDTTEKKEITTNKGNIDREIAKKHGIAIDDNQPGTVFL